MVLERPTFSLVLATCGRTTELQHFFFSLEQAKDECCECIIVDQNEDERLTPILEEWADRLTIKRIRCAKGLSRARNVGLRHASGKFVSFPDDDCWYSTDLLPRVSKFFAAYPKYDILSVGIRDSEGEISGNRWILDSCELATANLFRTSVGIGLFVRRSRVVNAIRFDESLGVGTDFTSGEDTDYVFRLIAAGFKGRFDRGLTVYHPRRDMLSNNVTVRRAFSYGRGMGRVIRKRAKLPLLPAFLAFDLVRAVFSLLRGRLFSASLCSAHGRGVFAGFLASK